MLFNLFAIGKPTLQKRAQQLAANKTINPVRAAATARDLELLEEALHHHYIDLTSIAIGRGLVSGLIFRCYWGVIALLLDYGWNVNRDVQTEEERVFEVPLITAISLQYRPVIRLLYLYGADFNIRNPSNIPAYRYLEPPHNNDPELKIFVQAMQVEVDRLTALKQQTDKQYLDIEPLLTSQTELSQKEVIVLQAVQQKCQVIAQYYLDFATGDLINVTILEERLGKAELAQFYRRKALTYYEKAANCLNCLCMVQPFAEKASAIKAYQQCLTTIFTNVLDRQFEEPKENERLKERITILRKKLQLVNQPTEVDMTLLSPPSSQTPDSIQQRRNYRANLTANDNDNDSLPETTRLIRLN